MNLKRRVAWGLAALLVAAAGIVALGVALIDTPTVRAEIQRRLSQAVDGQVAWQELDIGLLPPRAELRKVRVEMPGRLSAAADELNVGLRFWPLLARRWPRLARSSQKSNAPTRKWISKRRARLREPPWSKVDAITRRPLDFTCCGRPPPPPWITARRLAARSRGFWPRIPSCAWTRASLPRFARRIWKPEAA